MPASARESMHALFPNPAFHWPWVCAERCFMCWMRMLLESRAVALNATEFFFGSGIHQLFGIIVKLLRCAESRMSCPQKQQCSALSSRFVLRISCISCIWSSMGTSTASSAMPQVTWTRHDETRDTRQGQTWPWPRKSRKCNQT